MTNEEDPSIDLTLEERSYRELLLGVSDLLAGDLDIKNPIGQLRARLLEHTDSLPDKICLLLRTSTTDGALSTLTKTSSTRNSARSFVNAPLSSGAQEPCRLHADEEHFQELAWTVGYVYPSAAPTEQIKVLNVRMLLKMPSDQFTLTLETTQGEVTMSVRKQNRHQLKQAKNRQ